MTRSLWTSYCIVAAQGSRPSIYPGLPWSNDAFIVTPTKFGWASNNTAEAAIGHKLMTRYYLNFLLIMEFQWSWKAHHRKETLELWLHRTWNHLNSAQYIGNDGQISSRYVTPTLQTITFGSIDDYHKSDWRDYSRLTTDWRWLENWHFGWLMPIGQLITGTPF